MQFTLAAMQDAQHMLMVRYKVGTALGNMGKCIKYGAAPCAVRKVCCFPPPVAMGPKALNSAPPVLF